MSFRWESNAQALKNCIWTLQTDSETSGAVEIARRVIPTAEIRTIITPRISQPGEPIGAHKMQGLLKVIKQCLAERSRMLMATPDFIWGARTIPAMLKMAAGAGLCVSIAHLRVLPTILTEPFLGIEGLPENIHADLMGIGLRHQHPSWAACLASTKTGEPTDPNGIYHSGICWEHLTDSLIAVQHQMVSPFLVNFTLSDLEFFATWKGMTAPAFGEWDHNWPSKLIQEERLRYIGASDAACMLEVTEASKNMPPLEPRREPADSFFLRNHHNQIQRQFVSIFRHL